MKASKAKPSRWNARTVAPLAVLGVGFAFSLAANLLWCWPGGPVRILGGALASVALPAAVHMWPMIEAHDRKFRWLRNLLMLGIATLAALTTFSHASELLIAHGEAVWLARSYPVITELLVIFAVLARRGTDKSADSKPRTRAVSAPRPSASGSQPSIGFPEDEVAARRRKASEARAERRRRARERAAKSGNTQREQADA